MYINGKMRPVETIPGMGERKQNVWVGVNPSMIYLIYYKNLYKCHSVHLPSTMIKNN
jgi:hypothetical protein